MGSHLRTLASAALFVPNLIGAIFAGRPVGTKLRTRAHFDNSANNPFNPNPAIDVEWGEPTTAEMMLMFFRYTKPNHPMD